MIDYDTPKRALLQYIVYVLFKRKGLILWGFLLLFIPFVLATKLSYPVYHAVAKVWVHRTTTQQVSFMPDVQMPSLNVGFLPPGLNWIEVITGQHMAMEVVREFKLDDFYRQQKLHPSNFREKFWYGFKRVIYFPLDVAMDVAVWLGLMDPFEPHRDFFAYAVKKVQEDMITVVLANQMTDVMAISCYGPTPELAEQIANFLADRLITQIVAGEQGVARFAIDFAEQQLRNISDKLGSAEDALTDYQKKLGVLDISKQKSLQLDLADVLNTQNLTIEKQQKELQAKLDALDEQIEEQRSAFISTLILQKNYSDKQEVEVDLAANREAKTVVRGQAREVDGRAEELIEAEFVSKKLQRDIDIYSSIWAQFQDKLAKLQIETVSRLKAVAMEIIDPAYLHADADPVWPKDDANYVIGAILGLAMGLGFAFILEYFNDSLRTPTEVEQELDLPVLATIPDSPLGRQT